MRSGLQASSLLEKLGSLSRALSQRFGALPVQYRSALGWSFAAIVHAALICLVLFGLTRTPVPERARELEVTTIGGLRAIKSKPIEPELIPPDTPLVPPPEITIDDMA